MELREIIFVSQPYAERVIPAVGRAIISIRLPGEEIPLKVGWTARLDVEFHDITFERFGGVLFDESHALQIIYFLDHITAKENLDVDRLLVHCRAGISRSAAVALFAHRYYGSHLPGLSLTEFYNRHILNVLIDTFMKRL